MSAIVRLLLIVLIWAVAAGPTYAKNQLDHDASPEDLLFQDIPVVISSTRTERSALDVPNAVTVVTASDIKESGASTLEEILHWIPGLDVMRLSVGDVSTSMRGFNSVPATTLLVMIDGRSVYLDFFGNVSWDSLNVTVHDIERIEFIRGPGSVLYGAAALLGTVNIITKDPRDLPSAYSYTGIGSRTRHQSNTFAGTAGALALKASFEYRSLDDFSNTVTPADPLVSRSRDTTGFRGRLGNATLDYLFEDGARLTVAGGRSRSTNQTAFLNQTLDQNDAITEFGRLRYTNGPWQLQAFYSENEQDIRQSVNLGIVPSFFLTYDFFASTSDLEIQREIEVGPGSLLVGGNLRRLIGDSPVVLGSREEEMLYGAFMQHEYPVTDKLTSYLGLRLDSHPLAGTQLSPRGSLVYRFSDTGRVRASVSRSFRNPPMLANYVNLTLIPPATAGLVGNDDLDAQAVTAWEFGVRFSPRPRLSVTADVFFHTIEDSLQIGLAPAGPFLIDAHFVSAGKTTFWGSELALDWRLGKRTHVFASYSFLENHGDPANVSPRNKASLGLRGTLSSRLRYSLSGSYVGHTEVESTASPLGGSLALLNPGRHPSEIPSRFVVDGFLGYQVTERFELGLKARNLFHQVRRQYPLGDEIGSELLMTGTLEF